jgi:predicted transposase YdaD
MREDHQRFPFIPFFSEDLIELIETVIIYKLPRLSREEIQTMLQIQDIRESRVYQEAKEEGQQEERRIMVAKLAAKKKTAEEIAGLFDMEVEQVRQIMTDSAHNS